MKKIYILVFSLIALTANTFAQTTGKYCRIVGVQRFLSFKINVSIDYGEVKPYIIKEPNPAKPGKQRIKKFNSMIHALNYMDAEGWEFVSADVITVGKQNVYHYLLRKK